MSSSQFLKIIDRLELATNRLRYSIDAREVFVFRMHPIDVYYLLSHKDSHDLIYPHIECDGELQFLGFKIVRDERVARGTAALSMDVPMFDVAHCSGCGREIIDEEFHGESVRFKCLACTGFFVHGEPDKERP